jgi:hypothetical protein
VIRGIASTITWRVTRQTTPVIACPAPDRIVLPMMYDTVVRTMYDTTMYVAPGIIRRTMYDTTYQTMYETVPGTMYDTTSRMIRWVIPQTGKSICGLQA